MMVIIVGYAVSINASCIHRYVHISLSYNFISMLHVVFVMFVNSLLDQNIVRSNPTSEYELLEMIHAKNPTIYGYLKASHIPKLTFLQ
uniref:Ovule protein n=1 Tax=Panagrellus redivivus TaxID=6233 RepID=A0A7E4VQ78_PANRE